MFTLVLKKAFLVIGCFIGVVLLLGVFSYLYMELQFFFVVKDRIEHLPEKYQTYANNCITPLPTATHRAQQACCFESLERMYQDGYTLAPRAFSDDPTRGCGFTYAKLRCDGSLEWCDETSSQYPVEDPIASSEHEWKDQVLDKSLLIQVPYVNQIGSTQYSFQKESDQSDFHFSVPHGSTFHNQTFSYAASLMAAEDEPKSRDSVLWIFKAKIDFGDLSLSEWVKRFYDINLPDEFRSSSGKDDAVILQEFKTELGEDVIFFHMPVPSDNGWYAYRNSDILYLFSLGNSSYAINGHKNGLWDTMMRSLRVAKPRVDFSATHPPEWKQFRDQQFGVGFAYPGDWEVEKSNGGIILNSPQNQQALKDIGSGKMYGEGYMPTITIKRFGNVAHEDENMGLGIKTVPEMINLNPLVSNPERVALGSREYWAATRGGFGAYYTVFVDDKRSYFEIMFGYKERSDTLDEIERGIVSSMKFY